MRNIFIHVRMYTLTEKGRGWRTMRNDATRRVVDRKVVVLSPNTSRECSRMKITCPGTEVEKRSKRKWTLDQVNLHRRKGNLSMFRPRVFGLTLPRGMQDSRSTFSFPLLPCFPLPLAPPPPVSFFRLTFFSSPSISLSTAM